MWREAGVAEEDQLDREQAKQVMRRAGGDAAARTGARCIVSSVLIVLVDARRSSPGRCLVKLGIDHGITWAARAALNVAVVGLRRRRHRRLLRVPPPDRRWSSRVGEGFLRDLRIRVFDHLQRLSMPFYDREKAGVLVSRMTSDVDSLPELVQRACSSSS